MLVSIAFTGLYRMCYDFFFVYNEIFLLFWKRAIGTLSVLAMCLPCPVSSQTSRCLS